MACKAYLRDGNEAWKGCAEWKTCEDIMEENSIKPDRPGNMTMLGHIVEELQKEKARRHWCDDFNPLPGFEYPEACKTCMNCKDSKLIFQHDGPTLIRCKKGLDNSQIRLVQNGGCGIPDDK